MADKQTDAAKQDEQVERTGRTEEVTGEARSFKDQDEATPKGKDLTGPAGDPAEGKRPGGSSWPA